MPEEERKGQLETRFACLPLALLPLFDPPPSVSPSWIQTYKRRVRKLTNTLALLLPSFQVLYTLAQILLGASSKTETQTSFCRRRELLEDAQ